MAQNVEDPSEEICRSSKDAQAQTQRLKECDLDRREIELLKHQLKNKDDKIANLEEKIKIEEERNRIKDEMIARQDKVIEQYKDLTDRAIKLAETKKSNLFETWGPLAVIAIVVVTIAAVL